MGRFQLESTGTTVEKESQVEKQNFPWEKFNLARYLSSYLDNPPGWEFLESVKNLKSEEISSEQNLNLRNILVHA